MKILAALVAFTALATTAQAQTTARVVHVGEIVRTPTGARVGAVDRINDDGSLRVIHDDQFITLPANSITSQDGKVTTSLAAKEINKLHD